MKPVQLEKAVIYILVIVGVVLLSLPFIKESIVSMKLSATQLTVSTHLPEKISEEETIRMPTLGDLWKDQPQKITGYGFVKIEKIGFQQPLLVGLTNQQMLKGGVVMFPNRLLASNNFVILGHHLARKDLLFGPLKEAQVGMEVSVVYLEQVQKYIIIDKKIVEETDLSILQEQQNSQLTLVTCPTPTQTSERLVLTAVPIVNENRNQTQEENSIIESSQSSKLMIKKQRDLWQQQSGKNIIFLFIVLATMVVLLWGVHRLSK